MIKIIGERNTGTNYLSQLIKENLAIKILDDSAKRIPLLNKSEVYKNLFFRLTEKKNLGWKHANAFNENIIYQLQKNEKVKIIILVKNPYSFLLSLHKRPYHNYHLRNLSFSDFLKVKWPTVKREKTIKIIKNPIELWNNKINSYFELIEKFPSQVLIIRYEDLIISPKFELRKISNLLQIDFQEENFKNISKSTKNESKSFEDYAKYYQNEDWSKKISPQEFDAINQHLNLELLNKLAYKIKKS
jgi:hypothetical protein